MTGTHLQNEPPRLGVVLVQHDRSKYPRTLPRLFGTLAQLDTEAFFAVVDNALPGDWSHPVSGSIVHLGGDNSAWEFSAFDRGLDWLSHHQGPFDAFVLATDALLAYGDEVIDLIDDRTVAACIERGACVGWIDSFMQTCRIYGHRYDAWIRTSLLFLPAALASGLRPLAHPIDDDEVFSGDPAAPFRPDAPISDNLRRLLLEWLTRDLAEPGSLEEVWHSRFQLDAETLPLFRAKTKAILREHLLSARLAGLGAGCFDFRAVRRAHSLGLAEAALQAESSEWQWLGWKAAADRALQAGDDPLDADSDPGTLDGFEEVDEPLRQAPLLLLPPLEDPNAARESLRFFESEVLPFVLQRFAGARVEVSTDDGEPSEQPVALLLPPETPAALEPIARAAAGGAPPIGVWRAADGIEPADGHHYLRAERPWEFAEACCRMIEDRTLRSGLARAAEALATGDDQRSATG